jgi:hypothetical protein
LLFTGKTAAASAFARHHAGPLAEDHPGGAAV